ncbi:MAG: thioredoxin family protein [Planctomycetota bacterium]|nr:thioredoxin family protein [Planctomycetota bacterium]
MRHGANTHPVGVPPRTPPDARGPANRTGRRPAAPAAGLLAGVILALAAAGCGPSRLKTIGNEIAFEEQVLKADRPVVLEFGKGGCVWCMFMDSRMEPLIDEYQDRVIFARFELVNTWHKVLSRTLWKRYRIGLFPTVVLFVGGREKKRWVVDYNPDNYRKVLNEVVGPPAPKTPPPRR